MSFTITATVATEINYAASHQKKQAVVKNIHIQDAVSGQYVLKIHSEPAFLFEFNQPISITGTTAEVSSPAITFNDSFYRTDLIESQNGQIRIEVFDPDEPDHILGFLQTTVHIQPYLHWDARNYPDTLSAFMQPNDTLVQMVMKKAGEYAAAAGESMCGYQCRSTVGVRRQAGYIYRALQDMDIHYLSAPASFEKAGQKVRIPHQVLHEGSKQGTCLDLAILYATCLEAASLNAIIVVISGHAFSGVWLSRKTFTKPMIHPSDISSAEWQAVATEIIPVECTTFTDGKNIGFESAVSYASGNFGQSNIHFIIDVENARSHGEYPVYTYTDEPICNAPEENSSEFIREEFSEEKRTRIAQLRDQAMDLTIKSRLLNSTADPLSISFDIDSKYFLKGLSAQEAENIASEFMQGIEGKSQGKKRASSAKAREKKTTLRELYSKSVQNIRETGKNNLYIAVNELIWRQDSGKECHAVMYLCPAEIYRNRRGDYQLRINPEGIFFNPALKVLMNQKYFFDSAEIKDCPKEEYEKQIRYIKFLIEDQKGWQIKENTARLAMYSVPNASVWNGLDDPSVVGHEIVAGLLDGTMSWNNQIKSVERSGEKNDTDIYAFETDSSQKDIIEAAFERKAQVVVGPAGNGKTQTVVNIMTEAVRRGQTVLFVSEKASAMEVAYSKLNEVLDGLFNLRVIHGKDKPSEIVQQIRSTLDYLETHSKVGSSEDIIEEKEKYRASLEYLEKYYSCMTEKGSCGKSMEELINMYEKYSDCGFTFKLDDKILGIPLSEAEEKVSVYGLVLEDCDRANGRYSEYIRYDNMEGGEERETLSIAQAALNKFDSLSSEAAGLCDALGINFSSLGKRELNQTMVTARILADCPEFEESIEDIITNADKEESTYRKRLEEDLLSWEKAFSVPFLRNMIRSRCQETLREKYTINETKRILNDFEENPEAVLDKLAKGESLGDERNSNDNEIDPVESFRAFTKKAEKGLSKLSNDYRRATKRAIDYISSGKGRRIKVKALEVLDKYREFDAAQRRADKCIVKHKEAFNEKYPDVFTKVLYEEWIATRHIDSNRSRSLYDSIVSEMQKEGYDGFISQVESINEKSDIDRDEIMNSFHKSWALAQIEKRRNELLVKNEFNYLLFKSRVSQLAEKEQHIRSWMKQEIRRIQFDSMPDISEGVSDDPEFGILQRLVRLKKTTVRTFFEKAPNTLHSLFPCMIMDPSAVAEFIPSDFPKFDLVLIDEGSQMPMYNALIPIARAKRCMIFGDEKQLQPLKTFKMRGEEEEEDYVSGRDSILTAAYISSMPRKMLRFHYRSENESLIAFSNEHYYNGDIITFPSSDTAINGVSYIPVPEGIYDRKSKVNRAEAEQVICKIREIYENGKENRNETLGVITLNIHQRDLIQSLLMQEIKEDSSLGKKTDELVTVMNLEACQGKEWDYVIISPGFGLDEDGKLNMGFGALNKEFGANRLNVMLTRARKQMIVISSIEPHMLTNAKSEGVRDFREFLKYAQGEIVMDKRTRSSEERTTGLVNAVAKSLEEAGFEVHTNIGSSDFKVDLGIVSSDDSNKYAMGILVDHFNDVKSSIHDREVIYPGILGSKGWKVYRLCGLNWINDPRREIGQIKRALEGR